MIVKFNKPQPFRFRGQSKQDAMIRTSKCGHFTIITPAPEDSHCWGLKVGQKHFLREERMISLGGFTSLASAMAEASSHAAIREKVWHYYMERAQYEVDQAKRLLDHPEDLANCCEETRKGAEQAVAQTVEERALRLYDYLKYRAFANSNVWGSNYPLDPAARRDWQAQVDGTYVQWWKERLAS